MTENENSPENLRKFLESDDPAMVQMGLSMAKGTELDIAVKDLETLLQHQNMEIMKSGFVFAVENKREKEAIEAIFDGDGHSNAYKIGEIGETAIKPILKVLEEERARIGFPTEIRIIGGGIIDELIASLVEIGNVDTICFALEEYHPYLEWEGKEHYMEVLAETGHLKAIELILGSTWGSSKDSRHYHQVRCTIDWCHQTTLNVESDEYLSVVDYLLQHLGLIWDIGGGSWDGGLGIPSGEKVTITVIKILEEGGGSHPEFIIKILEEIGDKRAIEPITKFLNENQDWEELQEAGKEALEKLK